MSTNNESLHETQKNVTNGNKDKHELQKRRFASNLNILLKKNNLTQTDLAVKTGYKIPTVSSWCRGLRLPDKDKIEKLAEVLNTTPDELTNSYLSTVEDEKNEALRYTHLKEQENFLLDFLKIIELLGISEEGKEKIKAISDPYKKEILEHSKKLDIAHQLRADNVTVIDSETNSNIQTYNDPYIDSVALFMQSLNEAGKYQVQKFTTDIFRQGKYRK